jgi:plastocyanin
MSEEMHEMKKEPPRPARAGGIGRRAGLLLMAVAASGILSACMMGGGHHMNTGRDTRGTDPVQAEGAAGVRIVNYGFDPGNLRITAGTTVTWKNSDPVGHTATADAGVWGSPLLERGDEWSYTFTEPGTYTYFCAPHPQMKAQIEVVE